MHKIIVLCIMLVGTGWLTQSEARDDSFPSFNRNHSHGQSAYERNRASNDYYEEPEYRHERDSATRHYGTGRTHPNAPHGYQSRGYSSGRSADVYNYPAYSRSAPTYGYGGYQGYPGSPRHYGRSTDLNGYSDPRSANGAKLRSLGGYQRSPYNYNGYPRHQSRSHHPRGHGYNYGYRPRTSVGKK